MTTHDRHRVRNRFLIPAALAALVALGAPSAQANAATRTVCAEPGVCDYTTIQAAVNAASADDVIKVQAGSYNENVVIPAGKNGLTLAGAQAGVTGDDAA